MAVGTLFAPWLQHPEPSCPQCMSLLILSEYVGTCQCPGYLEGAWLHLHDRGHHWKHGTARTMTPPMSKSSEPHPGTCYAAGKPGTFPLLL